jgi:hypothetical protein
MYLTEEGDMGTWTIYRDGEEFEVGWFAMIVDRLPGFIRTIRATDWRHYFQGNGPGEVAWEKFTGFKEAQNSLDSAAQFCIQVKGGIRPEMGNCYYQNIVARGMGSIEAETDKRIQGLVSHSKDMIMRYVDPNCTCRMGFHKRCPLHGTREN